VNRPKNKVNLLLPALLLGGLAIARAQAPAGLDAELARCAAAADSTARLACYDKLAGAHATSASPATTAPATAGAGAGAAETAPSAAEFGVRGGPLQAKRDPVREKRLLAVVSNVSTRPRGELVVKLDNGQTWTQIQPANYPLKPGDHVEIDVAALGSYLLWCPSSRRATKVTRID
jgi:hypothetical protein